MKSLLQILRSRSQGRVPAQPNILFLMADQMRADALGIVNGPVRTPNLDQFAREGSLSHGVITNSAECIPARFGLVPSRNPGSP